MNEIYKAFLVGVAETDSLESKVNMLSGVQLDYPSGACKTSQLHSRLFRLDIRRIPHRAILVAIEGLLARNLSVVNALAASREDRA